MTKLLAVAVVLLSANAARADQCVWMTQEQAMRAAAVLKKGATVFSWCEPCGDRNPTKEEVVESISVQPVEGDYWSVSVNGSERDVAYLFVQTGPKRVDNVAALAKCPTQDVTKFIHGNDTSGTGGKYVLDSRFSELASNIKAIQMAEESLRQSEKEIESGAPVGLYWGIPRPVPAAGKLGTSALTWSPSDLAIASKLDWQPGGQTYARYHVVVGGGDGAFGPAMSICAESDLDGDRKVAAVVMFVPGRGPGGVAIQPPPAPCRAGPVLAPGRSLQFRPGIDEPRVPIRVSPEAVY